MKQYLKLLGIHPTACYYTGENLSADDPILLNLKLVKFPVDGEIISIKKMHEDCPLIRINDYLEGFSVTHFIIQDEAKRDMWYKIEQSKFMSND